MIILLVLLVLLALWRIERHINPPRPYGPTEIAAIVIGVAIIAAYGGSIL
jgi:hypothetical protein